MLKNKRADKVQIWTANGILILKNVSVANTAISRFKGLMWRKELLPSEGLIIKPCNSIHTFFMKMTLDAAFCNNRNQVIQVYRRMSPWKISKIHFDSSYVIEGSSGSLNSLEPGDYIVIKKTD